MRILEVSHFMPPHPGGIERVVSTLVDGLQGLGHEVRWVASADPAAPGISGPFIRVPAWNWLERGLQVPMPLWTPAAWKTLRKHVAWADVVHVHDCLYLSSAGATLLSRHMRKPVLITQHVGHVPYGGALQAVQVAGYHTLGRLLLRLADDVVTVSPHVAEYLGGLGLRRPSRHIAFGVDESFHPLTPGQRLAARSAWGLPGDTPVVIFAARLVAKKGVHHVVEVQRRLASEGVTLLVAGDGPLAPLLQDLPLTRHVRQVDHSRMPELFGLADALLLPSSGEGLPLTLQEAMFAGLPAVVSRDPSFVANVAEAPGVELAEGLDALTEAVRRCLSHSPPREVIASWARQRWGEERFVREYERALAALLHPRDPGSSPSPEATPLQQSPHEARD